MHEEHRDRRLSTLPTEVAPPPDLERRTVTALRREGLLRSKTNQATRVLLAAAALLAAFIGGRVSRASMEDKPHATHALLLYGGATTTALDHAKRAEEYGQWVTGAHGVGRVLGGEALASEGSALDASQRQAPVQIDGSDPMVGFFLIQAPTAEAALGVARTCPHLKYGGRVVVKQILPT